MPGDIGDIGEARDQPNFDPEIGFLPDFDRNRLIGIGTKATDRSK